MSKKIITRTEFNNDRFEVDKDLENKLLFTCNPDGYLKAHKDL